MKRMQAGFTMIELIVVIVILGVLAAVAMPKFTDLSGDAKAAALQGVAGAATSAMNVNYGARKVNSTKGVAVANCTDVANVLQGGLPTGTNGYTVTAAAVAPDASVNCTLTQTNGGATATFTAIGIN
jgi:prepilin-type N-terminal cleavage/methylation domain-containing protein